MWPMFRSFSRETSQNCGCCRRRDVDALTETRHVARGSCSYDIDQDEHHCTPTTDDTICSKRNCPSSLHLQALASQFLSMQGIIACAATRLVLRKIPGSNVTTTMEDTMARAQKAINTLTKDQLLSESRNAQQVNALINLHMTANPPPNIIPVLTLVQLKMNLLKAQVEGLVSRKLMETQGVGIEVETDPIDPTVLALKSDAELRDLLSALRQKECDERVNVNFAPYRSQRAIAESRLSNVQNKIRQVEGEFDRRRCAMLPAPTLSTRIVQQFTDPCYSVRLEDPRRLYRTLPPDPSPDPFAAKPRSPKRLLLKQPCPAGNPETASQTTPPATHDTRVERSTDSGLGRSVTERSTETDRDRSSTGTHACDRTMSEESVGGAKKKPRVKINEIDETTARREDIEEETDVSSARLTPGVCINVVTQRCRAANSREQERSPHGEDAKRWLTKACVNVADYKPTRTLMESGSDTITPSGKIDARDVCKSSDAIATRSPDRVTDREESERSADLRQTEKQAVGEITISGEEMREAIEKDNVPVEISPSVTPMKAAQEEAKAIVATEIADDDRVLSTQETEQVSPLDTYTSALQVTLKLKKEKDGQKGGNGEISPSLAAKVIKRNASGPSISGSQKRTRFHIVSLLMNIVYDREREYQRKRQIDGRTATSGKRTIQPDIEKLHEYSSTDNLSRHANARDIAERDHTKNATPGRPDLSKFRVDRQCQTVSDVVKEDTKAPVVLLRANIFPPSKHLRKPVAGNEKERDNVGAYPSTITKTGITATKGLFRCNDVEKDTADTFYEDNAPYLSADVEHDENFISGIFSVIGNPLVTFINKMIALNRRLLKSDRGTILCENIDADVLKRTPIRDRSGSIRIDRKDRDVSAGTLGCSDVNQGTSRSGKHNCRDGNSVFAMEGYGGRIRKIKHSIIEDKKANARYLLIDTSNRDLTLTRDLGRSYEKQRSLLIRSRLKDFVNLQDHPCPLSLLKHAGNNALESYEVTRNESVRVIERAACSKLKSSEKFWILSEVTKTNENNCEKPEMEEYGNEFIARNSKQYNDRKQVFNKHLHNDIKNNMFTKQERAGNEHVLNVHDYLGLQTEINMNMCENRSTCLLTSSN
ncbi:uncharacterized protein LOC116851064 isoform X2 [Odontomachus brunneus]|uniref:uncharacterized protein LOC116851064 isoform X2 n=1 Tax=Odontomachus brunneus TaxID=486640 RepID=UPI0013F20881|nr:uncharacterized protein LOC116851064 isoform X2 [Odontomachus brunneus]